MKTIQPTVRSMYKFLLLDGVYMIHTHPHTQFFKKNKAEFNIHVRQRENIVCVCV